MLLICYHIASCGRYHEHMERTRLGVYVSLLTHNKRPNNKKKKLGQHDNGLYSSV